MTEGVKDECSNCRFYKPSTSEGGNGECVFLPPVIVHTRLGKGERKNFAVACDSGSPPTSPKGWCGKYESNSQTEEFDADVLGG